MPTHKPSTGEMSLTELRAATGVSAPTIKLRLGMAPAIRPVRADRRTAWFDAPTALARILAPPRAAGGDVLVLEDERARLAAAQADGQLMRNAEASRAMIPRNEVLQHWANLVLNAREQLRNIPANALVRVPGFTRAMAKPLADLIDAALTELGSGKNGVPPPRTVRKHRTLRSASREESSPDAA
jgi:hypothetical protein